MFRAKVSKVDDDDANVVSKTEAVLSFKGCGSDTKRENIKELFNQWSEVAWVDFKMGDTEVSGVWGENMGVERGTWVWTVWFGERKEDVVFTP